MSKNNPFIRPDHSKIITYDEVLDEIGLDAQQIPYYVTDSDGRKVRVTSKNPAKHDSYDDLDNHAVIFANMGSAICDPDEVVPLTSNNKKALEHKKDGMVKVYKKKKFLALVGMAGFKNTERNLLVIVKYPNKTEECAYTLTHRFEDVEEDI